MNQENQSPKQPNNALTKNSKKALIWLITSGVILVAILKVYNLLKDSVQPTRTEQWVTIILALGALICCIGIVRGVVYLVKS